MRDIVLTLFLLASLPIAIARPFFGAMIFAWLALMNPHQLTWSFASNIPWSFLFGLATTLGFVFTRDRLFGPSVAAYALPLAYIAWMGISTAFALEADGAAYRYEQQLKTQWMCLVTLCLLTTRRRALILAALCVASIAFYGFKGGIFTVLTGGAHRVYGPATTVIEENNQLAAALVMTLPLVYWGYRSAKARWLRLLCLAALPLMAISVFGSHSRGAFVAIAAMGLFLVMRSDRRFFPVILVAGAAALAPFLMPDQYWERIESIQEYQQDASAQGRINSWSTAINIANHRVTGGGFNYYTPRVFAMYAPNPNDLHSSHSIYFQAIGEQGWPGFALFLSFWILIWVRSGQLVGRAQGPAGDPVAALWGRMMQVSIVGYFVAGAFVNIGNWDYTYYLAIVVLALHRLLLPGAAVDRTDATADARAGARPGSPKRFRAARAESRSTERGGGLVG